MLFVICVMCNLDRGLFGFWIGLLARVEPWVCLVVVVMLCDIGLQ